MDEDVSSGPATRHAAPPRPDFGLDPAVSPSPPRPTERARYQPLRGLEELLDDFLGPVG